MSYGFEVTTSSGKVINSSVIPVTLLDIIGISPGQSGSKSYPNLSGLGVTLGVTVQKTVNTVSSNPEASVSYPSGIPTVNWFPSNTGGAASGGLVIVFVR